MAEILTRVVGRTVHYRPVSIDMFIKSATAQGISAFEVSQLRQYAEDIRRDAFAVGGPTSHVEELTGRAPEDFESIARRYVADPDLIVHGFSSGTKVGAVLGLLKMMLTRVIDFDRWEADRGHPMLSGPQLAPDSSEWMAAAEQQTLALIGPSAATTTPGERAGSLVPVRS